MNEQKKRDLMLRFAAENDGEWDSCYSYLVFNGECFCFEITGENAFCTRTEFEAFINFLFEGAPDGATHYGNNCYFMKSGKKWWSIGVNDRVWQKCFGGLDISKLIPRPRKQEKTAECEQCKAYEDIGNAMFESGCIDKQEQLNIQLKQNVESILWTGEGLPPVGVKCDFSCTAKGKEYSNVVGVVKYMSQYTCVMSLGGSEFVAHPATMTFRPLKTEAEKERERLIEMVKFEIESLGCDPSYYGDPNRVIAERLVDSGLVK